ncbi:MAG: LysR family transcriptional regulator [Alphaproteobacteria bacterium]|nr:LysR family transcriptional regulator [Alphaproteobacteria bacterium]
MENWDGLRVAYQVAKLGTLSAAAEVLGVHHATVIRQIDALEAELGVKLFQRHARGYTPTEAGQDLLRVAAATEDQLNQFAVRAAGNSGEIEGDLVVTSLSGMSPQITPLLVAFQHDNPRIRISLVAQERKLRLEYGEAHVAIRAGARPTEPDNIVQSLGILPVTLFAHKDYVARFGPLKGDADLDNHQFVTAISPNSRAPFQSWFSEHVPPSAIVYCGSDIRSVEDAVHEGAGIGFISLLSGGANPDLVAMMERRAEWDTEIWMVTHMDLHRSAKVRAFVKFFKPAFQKILATAT